MKTQVKALTMFVHGRINAEKDGVYEVNKAEAEDLQKTGLVEIVQADGAQDQHGDVDDVLGGDKAEVPHDNKMAEAPANKSAKRK